MPKVITRKKGHFRIEIRDLKTGKTKTITLDNHDKIGLIEIYDKLFRYFNEHQ